MRRKMDRRRAKGKEKMRKREHSMLSCENTERFFKKDIACGL
jgi:hypothetical protein